MRVTVFTNICFSNRDRSTYATVMLALAFVVHDEVSMHAPAYVPTPSVSAVRQTTKGGSAKMGRRSTIEDEYGIE